MDRSLVIAVVIVLAVVGLIVIGDVASAAPMTKEPWI